MEQFARTRALSADTLCWNPDFGDTWRPLSQTMLYANAFPSLTTPTTAASSSALPSQPVAATGPVSDVYVWTLAVLPVIMLGLQLADGTMGPVSAASTIGQVISLVSGCVAVYLVIADTKQLDRRGTRNSGPRPSAWWALLVPVYLMLLNHHSSRVLRRVHKNAHSFVAGGAVS